MQDAGAAALVKFQTFLDETPELGVVWAADAGDTLIREMKRRFAATKRGREVKPQTTFAAWCASQPDPANLLPGDHPVNRWADSVGLPEYFVYLGWMWFVREYGPRGPGAAKRQRDWLQHFDNSVRKRWGRLWYAAPGGEGFRLSADGEILSRQYPDEARG